MMGKTNPLDIWTKEDFEAQEKAIEAWQKSHLFTPSLEPLAGYMLNGKPIIVFFHEGDELPFSVQYAGSSTHYKRKKEAMELFDVKTEQARKRRRYRRNYIIRQAIKYLENNPGDLERIQTAMLRQKVGGHHEQTGR